MGGLGNLYFKQMPQVIGGSMISRTIAEKYIQKLPVGFLLVSRCHAHLVQG